MTFHAEVDERGHGVVLRMVGDLDASADVGFLAAHGQAVAADPSTIVLDFTEVGYINSSGIALIVTLLIEARNARRAVRAVGLSRHYRHIFEITRLTDYLTFDDDDSTATVTGGTVHA